MRRARALGVALGACTPPASRALPGVSLTPRPEHAVAARACGDDVAFDGDAAPDVRYSFSYDELGRLVGEIGVYSAGGSDETIALSYDNLDHETSAADSYPGGTTEIAYDYDTLGDLVDYTNATASQVENDTQRYVMSNFTPTGQPLDEVVTVTGEPDAHYVLTYDASARLVLAVRDGASVTTYTYDDDGRTVSIDTDRGAFTGTIIYDDDDNELSETWGGSDPSALASQTSYTYDGDRLIGITYERGTPLAVIETDTLFYCTP
jgi:YD repeat-containing protein